MLVFPVFLCLMLQVAAENQMQIIEVSEGENVSLPCTAVVKKGLDYWACRWYKENGSSLTGLLSSTPPGGRLRYYVNADVRMSLEYPSLSLQLPPAKCSDGGVYQCYMAANVGEQNREGRVRLSVTGCPIDFEVTPEAPEKLPKRPELMVVVAGLVLAVFLASLLIYLFVTRTKRTKSKSVDKLLYPDLSHPLEKQLFVLPSFMPAPLTKNNHPDFSSI